MVLIFDAPPDAIGGLEKKLEKELELVREDIRPQITLLASKPDDVQKIIKDFIQSMIRQED